MSRHMIAAIVLALAGVALVVTGLVDREMARAEQDVFALKYAEAGRAFDAAEGYVRYEEWVPWIRHRVDDVRTRRAALQYWQHDYDRIVRGDSDPLAGIPADNIDLQLIAANAAYRKSQPGAKNRASALRALDAAANAYLAVLRNARGHEIAAYNYEYILRLRDDIDKGRHAADLTDTAEDGPAGRQGGPPPKDPNKRDFKILIPLEPGEMDKAVEPGKGAPIERKG
jgi:hypothetical protein